MANFLENLRAFARGELSESALSDSIADTQAYDFEGDEEFMQECFEACLPTLVQMELMDEDADQLDEDVRDAFNTIANYYVQQGVISEAAVPKITNTKINVVHLSRAAQLKRLTSIIVLKMARRANLPQFKKYKLGSKIKKENMAEMRKRYESSASKIAKKLMTKNRKSGKAVAVISEKKHKK